MNRLLHLIYDPIPVSDGLHRDGAASRQASQECPVRFSIMIHSLCQFPVSRFIHNDKQRIFLVRITTDKMSHAATPPMVLTDRGYGTHQSVLQRFHQIKMDVKMDSAGRQARILLRR
jgi:hypothetical protein